MQIQALQTSQHITDFEGELNVGIYDHALNSFALNNSNNFSS